MLSVVPDRLHRGQPGYAGALEFRTALRRKPSGTRPPTPARRQAAIPRPAVELDRLPCALNEPEDEASRRALQATGPGEVRHEDRARRRRAGGIRNLPAA